jgi:hypothetical protein
VNAFVIKPIDFSEFVKAIKGIGYFGPFTILHLGKI